jgi:hypothetical protein
MCHFHQRHEDLKELERTVNTSVTRLGPKRVPDGEIIVKRRYLQQHMLETTKSGPENNVKGKAAGDCETSAQPCAHRSKTHTVVRRNERVLLMQQPV